MPFERGQFLLNASHSVRFIKLAKLHVQCKDKDGNPMAGRAYRVQLPRGQTVEGELDANGWAKHDDIYPGECTFELLPDGEVLTPVEQPREPAMLHLRLRFEDDDGEPFVSKPFTLTAGSLNLEGTTDSTGKLEADVPATSEEGEITIWLEDDKSGKSYSWPIKISDPSG